MGDCPGPTRGKLLPDVDCHHHNYLVFDKQVHQSPLDSAHCHRLQQHSGVNKSLCCQHVVRSVKQKYVFVILELGLGMVGF